MEAFDVATFCLAAAAFLLALVSPLLAKRLVVKAMAVEAKKAIDLIVDLKSWTARAAGTIRHVKGRLGYKPELASIISDEDEADSEDSPRGLPPVVMGLAQSLGIDPARVMAGDSVELGKVQDVLAKLKGTGTPQAAQPPAVTGPFL